MQLPCESQMTTGILQAPLNESVEKY